MKKTFLLVPAFVCVLFIACNDRSNETTETSNTSTSSNTARDGDENSSASNNNVVTDEKSKEFLTKAANDGMTEVQLAQQAQQKASIDAVKNYAAMLEQDHKAANDKVKSFASQRNVSLSTSIPADKQKMIDDMNKMSGKSFDKDYISMMIKDHKSAIDLFENARSNVSDVDVKNFADQTLPTLKKHLDSAQAIQKRYW